ncbi:hypothetical protein [Agromyces salentinus]|uniref:Uncharacterized protein n=1 Tax=Agromyces salentinus TaxID=269421 RepID=A0ABP4YXV1_9MICO|nr:hypothetical protein [Agromyces salentinus]
MGITATEIGHRIHASAEVVNRLLLEKGLTHGEPGAYGITDKGAMFGAAIDKENGYGGWAHRNWGWNSWNESVIDELGATPEKIAEVSAAIKAEKAVKRAADKLEAEQYWAGVMAEKAQKFAEDTSEGGTEAGLTNGQKMLIGVTVTVVGVVGGVLIYKGVKRNKRKKAERAERDATAVS